MKDSANNPQDLTIPDIPYGTLAPVELPNIDSLTEAQK